MESVQFKELVEQLISGAITPEGKKQFLEYVDQPQYRAELEAILQEAMRTDKYEMQVTPAYTEQFIEKLVEKMHTVEDTPVRPMYARWKWGWAAAIAVILLGSATYFLLQRPVAPVKAPLAITDVAPGSNKAVLTLGDGSVVTLDSAGNKVLQQGAIAIRQQGGILQYDVQEQAASASINTLVTPRGGQYQLILPDGSKVWLNAASSLRYPTAFNESARTVELQGEAYFEISTQKTGNGEKVPFFVKTGKMEVEVLGTHFNVMAYPDEQGISTTLLEGAVRLRNDNMNALIKPGEQGILDSRTNAFKVQPANTDKIMSWKNGIFNFQDNNLAEVMRQLSRWYDIDVVYEKGIPDIVFEGRMGRDLKLSVVLSFLEKSGVHFKLLDERKLVVTP
ncbi:FecR family protein [Chitinophaga defluvii]|uniref:FecR family protein n=1 Tax=Chitinophaga defluvii TaxID=3163343 RepID=A0ABV2T3Y1_9BACT